MIKSQILGLNAFVRVNGRMDETLVVNYPNLTGFRFIADGKNDLIVIGWIRS